MFRDIEISPQLPAAPFASLSEAKTFLNISGTGEDAYVTSLLTVATQGIETYCNCVIAQRTVTERVQPEAPFSKYVLRHCPVITLTSLEFDTAAQTVSDFRLASTVGILRKKDGENFDGTADWVFTYTAGYATTPEAVKRACLALVKSLYDNKDRNSEIQRESVPDVADVSYFPPGTNMVPGPAGGAVPSAVAVMLEPYVQRFAP